ncbi:TetR/AcrR family transcriptional regulator [Clostridium chromiireducens]|uniref:TetR/AcrR family transcriptional regulator n=1 Tax=Clostridium chromiireducens TaxID=225345 RepID=A0A399IMF1_9CLOT|nr:TetR/AcrR family transcriptional regulator [Clostridium chromiireducens]RII34223.1 TetR/AcrR family transcriptional regulator [Clostridium chromiireducens]
MDNIIFKKTEEKKELKRKVILKAAADVFSKKGYIDASIKDITNEASISVGSFYSYFSNKEEILIQIFEEISNMSMEAASESSKISKDNIIEQFTSSMTSAICIYAKNKEFAKILFVKSMGINELFEKKRSEILDRTTFYLKMMLEHLSKNHLCVIDNIEITSVLLTHSIFGVITNWLDERLKCSIEDIIFSLCTYHLKALNINYTAENVNKYIKKAINSDYKELLK